MSACSIDGCVVSSIKHMCAADIALVIPGLLDPTGVIAMWAERGARSNQRRVTIIGGERKNKVGPGNTPGQVFTLPEALRVV